MSETEKDQMQNALAYFKMRVRRINAQQEFNGIINRLSSGHYDYNDKIFQMIDKIIMGKNSPFIKILPADIYLYRAREIDVDDFKARKKGIRFNLLYGNQENSGYNDINSREAPLGISDEGRNNIKGMSYLYLADTPETACAEIKSSIRSLVSVAKFKTKHEMKIVDFSRDVSFVKQVPFDHDISYGEFFTELMSSFTYPDKREYKVTEIISDYIRRYGVDGIAYRSFYTEKTNYTIFNSYKNGIEFCKSKILFHACDNEYFWDFQNAKSIETMPIGKGKYDPENAAKIIKELSTATGD